MGDRLAHPVGGGALIDSSLVPVCLLNRNTSAFYGLLARWQQVVLEQTDHLAHTTKIQNARLLSCDLDKRKIRSQNHICVIRFPQLILRR